MFSLFVLPFMKDFGIRQNYLTIVSISVIYKHRELGVGQTRSRATTAQASASTNTYALATSTSSSKASHITNQAKQNLTPSQNIDDMSNSMSPIASPSQMVLSILSKPEIITLRRSRVIKPDPDLDRNKLKAPGLSVQELCAGLNTLPPEVRVMVYFHFFRDATFCSPLQPLWHKICANHVLYNDVDPTTEQHTEDSWPCFF